MIMKKVLAFNVIVAIFFLSSCQKEKFENFSQPNPGNSFNQSSQFAAQGVVQTFKAVLSGDQEVPPNDSNAKGNVIFQLSRDGEELSYRLIVANLDNVTQAHIHYGEAGVNGPVVVWLYPAEPPSQLIPGTTSGVLQEGVITKDNLVGMLNGEELSALVDLMNAQQVYVNVHTSQYPPGEIRGQIFGTKKGN
jgi:hypothetical protein